MKIKSPTPEGVPSGDSSDSPSYKGVISEKSEDLETTAPSEIPKDETELVLEPSKPGKKSTNKTPKTKPDTAKTKPDTPEYKKHAVEISELGLKQVDVIENAREKPEEKESIFVRSKLKKSSVVKREIEKPKLETVDLIKHADEPIPVSEEVSLENQSLPHLSLAHSLRLLLNSKHIFRMSFRLMQY